MDIFESFCRTCGNECQDPINIFVNKDTGADFQNGKVSISEMLQTCAPESLSKPDKDDDYPKQICRLCLKKLEMAYEFHMKWLSAHSEFNVALKFEQRRKRSRKEAQTKSEEQEQKQEDQPTIKTLDQNVTKEEPKVIANELLPSAAPCNLEPELPSATIPSPTIKYPERLTHNCPDCEEQFYTNKACQFHRSFVHQNRIN